MKKLNIKKEIDSIYTEVVDHKGLPPAYRVGMRIFKNRIINFIHSTTELGSTVDSRFNNKEAEEAIAFGKWLLKNKSKIDFGRAWSSIYYEFTKSTDR